MSLSGDFPLVPGYRLSRFIGSDRLADWYAAEQLSLSRAVSLRLLKPALSGSASSRRAFLAEAALAASLRHRNLLAVVDAREQPVPMLASEEMGPPLAHLLSAGRPMGEREALTCAGEAAQALAYLDLVGLAHRDLSPTKLHLYEGRGLKMAVVGDLIPAAARAELRGRLVQDPRYIAPEQVGGESPVDVRAATYQVGALLFHMLTGRPPHAARTPMAMAQSHLREPFPSIVRARPFVTAWVADLVRAATHQDAQARIPLEEFAARALAVRPAVRAVARRQRRPRSAEARTRKH